MHDVSTNYHIIVTCDMIAELSQQQQANPHGKNQHQIGRPKLGGKSESATQQSATKCRGFSTGPKGNCGTEPTLLPLQSQLVLGSRTR
jgi:hypothetical protein